MSTISSCKRFFVLVLFFCLQEHGSALITNQQIVQHLWGYLLSHEISELIIFAEQMGDLFELLHQAVLILVVLF